MPKDFEEAPAPQEVVGVYAPKEPQEVKDCYVQPRPLPRVTQTEKTAEKPKKRRRNLIVFCAIVGVLLVAVAIAVITSLGGSDAPADDDHHDASSIVDISDIDTPTIPRAATDPEVRFSNIGVWGEEALTATEVYAAVNPSVVLVVAEQDEKASVGTGVILTEDGYIVTNAHVIAGSHSAWIALYTGLTYEVELVGFDSVQDIAVLKAVDARVFFTPAVLADSDWCMVGDTVYAIGNPLGVELRGTLTDGIISAIDRHLTMEGRVMTLLQTTAALNNGNSGGPLINECGQVIGINTLKMSGHISSAATVEGLGFAVPMTRAVSVVNDIIATGAFHGFPTLGIYVLSTAQPDGSWQLSVDSVTEDFGGEEAGLLPGDILLEADGQPLATSDDLLAVRQTHIVGETVTLTVQRGEEVFDVDIMLYAQEEEEL